MIFSWGRLGGFWQPRSGFGAGSVSSELDNSHFSIARKGGWEERQRKEGRKDGWKEGRFLFFLQPCSHPSRIPSFSPLHTPSPRLVPPLLCSSAFPPPSFFTPHLSPFSSHPPYLLPSSFLPSPPFHLPLSPTLPSIVNEIVLASCYIVLTSLCPQRPHPRFPASS